MALTCTKDFLVDQSSGLTVAKYLFSLLKPRYLGLGFFWACGLLVLRTSSLFPYAENVVLVSTTLQLFSIGFSIATLVIIGFMETRSTGFVDRLPSWLFASLCIAGIAVFAASTDTTTGIVSLDMLMLGCTMFGVSDGYFWAVWYQAYSKLHLDVTSTALPLTFILTAALYLAIPLIAAATLIPIWAFLIPLPILSAVLLVRCKRKDAQNAPIAVDNRILSMVFVSLKEIIAAIVIFSFLYGFIWESSLITVTSRSDVHYAPAAFSLCAALVLVIITTFGRRRWDINLLYEYGVPIVVIAFALFPIMFATDPVPVDSIMDGGFSILEILTIIMVVSVSYDHCVSGAITGSVVRAALIGFMAVGNVAAYFIYQFAIQSSISSALFSILAIVAIWVWLMFSRHDDSDEESGAGWKSAGMIDFAAEEDDDEPIRTLGQAFEEWASAPRTSRLPSGTDDGDYLEAEEDAEHTTIDVRPSESAEPAEKSTPAANPSQSVPTAAEFEERAGASEAVPYDIDRLCAAVSDHYGLTRREAELMPSLAMGRSASYIADKFFVSENTVRTHIRHIIEKTGVESKRAITDFVYEKGQQLIESEGAGNDESSDGQRMQRKDGPHNP